MNTSFTHALTRPPGANFAGGLTSANLGQPDLALARQQHAAYCRALEKCGLAVTVLEAEENFPDSTFVEDPAVVTAQAAMLTRPGAASRLGEVGAIRPALQKHFPALAEIREPGTLDGGDVCEVGRHYFIGVSARTNEPGAWQLAAWLKKLGHDSTLITLPSRPDLLHLKSGLAWLGGKKLAVVAALAKEPALCNYEQVHVPEGEEYAANCLRVNDTLLIARGFPQFEAKVRSLEKRVVALNVSEFRKMDGGLSCLSLRW